MLKIILFSFISTHLFAQWDEFLKLFNKIQKGSSYASICATSDRLVLAGRIPTLVYDSSNSRLSTSARRHTFESVNTSISLDEALTRATPSHRNLIDILMVQSISVQPEFPSSPQSNSWERIVSFNVMNLGVSEQHLRTLWDSALTRNDHDVLFAMIAHGYTVPREHLNEGLRGFLEPLLGLRSPFPLDARRVNTVLENALRQQYIPPQQQHTPAQPTSEQAAESLRQLENEYSQGLTVHLATLAERLRDDPLERQMFLDRLQQERQRVLRFPHLRRPLAAFTYSYIPKR